MKTIVVNVEIIEAAEELGISLLDYCKILLDYNVNPKLAMFKDTIEANYVKTLGEGSEAKFQELVTRYPNGDVHKLKTDLMDCRKVYYELLQTYDSQYILDGLEAYKAKTPSKYYSSLLKFLTDKSFIPNEASKRFNNTKLNF